MAASTRSRSVSGMLRYGRVLLVERECGGDLMLKMTMTIHGGGDGV